MSSRPSKRIFAKRVTVRPARDFDLPLRKALYASVRAAEMAMVPWSETEKQLFVDLQFQAQFVGYRGTYPDADYGIIELDGDPVGRIYIDRGDNEIILMEITILPELRGQGIGTFLLQQLLDEAAVEGKFVSLHVEETNPAKRLYERHGFQVVTPHPLYTRMEWRPDR